MFLTLQRLLALAFSLPLFLGCVDCSNLRTWHGGERESPVNTVMSLRFHLCESDWAQAARSIAPGSEYLSAHAGDPSTAAFWQVQTLIGGEGDLFFPLGPEDEISGARPHGTQMQVEIRHKRRYVKDPRPRGLLLEDRNGEWLIVGYRNW